MKIVSIFAICMLKDIIFQFEQNQAFIYCLSWYKQEIIYYYGI